MTARQLDTLFTTNIKLALQYVGRWCMNLNALLYATFNLCMLRTEKFHHNWQVIHWCTERAKQSIFHLNGAHMKSP